MCRALGSEGGSLAWCPLSSRASMRLAAAACTLLRVHSAHPPRCWATCLAQDGTCQAEADIWVGGFSCCATTPALYCQKNTASQVLGTCETGECDVMAVVKMLGGEGHWAGGTGHGAWGMAAQPGTRAAMRARS